MAGAKMGRLCAQMGVTLTQALASSLGLGFLPVHGGEGGSGPPCRALGTSVTSCPSPGALSMCWSDCCSRAWQRVEPLEAGGAGNSNRAKWGSLKPQERRRPLGTVWEQKR